jgi:hypothetical protein
VRCSNVTPTQAKAIAINASRTITRNANIALYLNVAFRYVRASLLNRKRRFRVFRQMVKSELRKRPTGA